MPTDSLNIGNPFAGGYGPSAVSHHLYRITIYLYSLGTASTALDVLLMIGRVRIRMYRRIRHGSHMVTRLANTDYAALAAWRYALRRFLRASEEITRRAGVSPTQYQLLLFVRGSDRQAPSVADLAEKLQIRHQSAVGLIDRCERARLVRRRRDPLNRRRVLVQTTRRGGDLIRRLAGLHFATIESLGSAFLPPLPGAVHRMTGDRRS